MKKCNICGAPVEAGALFCTECGSPFDDRSDPKSRGGLFTAGKVMLIISAVLLFIMAAIVLLAAILLVLFIVVLVINTMTSVVTPSEYIAHAVVLVVALLIFVAALAYLALGILNLIAIKQLSSTKSKTKYTVWCIVILASHVILTQNIPAIVGGILLLCGSRKALCANNADTCEVTEANTKKVEV